MANCPNCHAPLEEGAGFCGVCGTPVPKQVICSHCGQATAADGMFCERCGQPLAPAAQAPAVPEAPVVAAQPVVPAAENTAPADPQEAPEAEAPAVPETPAQVTCPHCGQATAADGMFCERCGQPVGTATGVPETPAAADSVDQTPAAEEAAPAQVVCAHCGQVTSADGKFCERCGQPIGSGEQPAAENAMPAGVPVPPAAAGTAYAAPADGAAAAQSPVKKVAAKIKALPKKILAIIAAAAVLVVVLLVAVIASVAGGDVKPPVLYYADGELQGVMQGKWNKPFEVTKDFSSLANDDYILMTQYSENGRYMFYLDGGGLYYRDLKKNNANTDGTKIDSEIEGYFQITPNGKRVLYIKSGKLYEHNLKEKQSLASDVIMFFMSEDGKTVLYQTDDGDLYTKAVGSSKEAVKIDSEAEIKSVSKDMKTLYYTKDGSLYVKSGNKDKEKIAEGDAVDTVIGFGGKEIYFFNDASLTGTAADYVDDDMKAADDAMTEPVAPEYPSREYPDFDDYRGEDGFIDWDAYNAAQDKADEEYDKAREQYDKDYEEYQTAREEYREKESRDSLRESLAEAEVTVPNYQLYYYDGSKATLVAENVTKGEVIRAKETPAIVYSKNGEADTSKVKLSEISSVSDVTEKIAAGETGEERFLAVKEKESTLEQDGASMFQFDAKGSTLYFVDMVEEGVGVLKAAQLGGNGVRKIDTIDEDVGGFFLRDKGDAVYAKDIADGSGDLYSGGKLLLSDVRLSTVATVKDSDKFFCLSDYSDSSSAGALQAVTNKAVKVKDDVHSFVVYSEKCVAFLSDYSTDRARGTMEVYTGGNPRKVADDVTYLVPKVGSLYDMLDQYM